MHDADNFNSIFFFEGEIEIKIEVIWILPNFHDMRNE